jgi:hypothetical protein
MNKKLKNDNLKELILYQNYYFNDKLKYIYKSKYGDVK